MSSISSSASVMTMVEEDCPICLEEMRDEDFNHPLQCARHCGYNFCQDCIESLIVSSKDDYMEASDGNRHVKVFLHCPNCRSNLSSTIRDTLLLRKTDTVRRLTQLVREQQEQSKVTAKQASPMPPQHQLTESQQRLLTVLDTEQVCEAIKLARKLEDDYLGKKQRERASLRLSLCSSAGPSASLRCSVASSRASLRVSFLATAAEQQEMMERSFVLHDSQDWGVEADIFQGVHESFKLPAQRYIDLDLDGSDDEDNFHKDSVEEKKSDVVGQKSMVDITLFASLDDFLTDDQRKEITAQMTSGNPDDLAKASLFFWHVIHGEPDDHPSNNHTTNSNSKPSSIMSSSAGADMTTTKNVKQRSSIFQLISESNAAHKKNNLPLVEMMLEDDDDEMTEKVDLQELRFLCSTVYSSDTTTPSNETNNRLLFLGRQNLQQQVAFKKTYPLPVRMPKTIELRSVPKSSSSSNGYDDDYCHNNLIQLGDYTWDGTVIDAYSKITVTCFGESVYQHDPPRRNPGVRRILSGLDGQMEMPGQGRVVILEAGRQAGKQGAVRGDVITHINGTRVESLVSSSPEGVDHGVSVSAQVEGKLLSLLHQQQQQHRRGHAVEPIMITLNAERSVAEALKRRAAAIGEDDEQYK